MDPGRVRPLLDEKAQRGFDLLVLTNPPVVEAEIWGSFRDSEKTSIKGRVSLTNFAFRGQAASWLQAGVQYSNRVLQVFEPRIARGDQFARADGLSADFNSEMVYLTNASGTFDPLVIAAAIGPKTARTIQPYKFESPPNARVNGTIPMHGEEGADLHFDLEGGPFSWWKFHVPRIAGHIHWSGLHLSLSRVFIADFYRGTAAGSADFDFPPGKAALFKFNIGATNVLLQALMSDLSVRTNQPEGFLNGTLVATSGQTDNWDTLMGYGDLNLRDGLLWDIPVFGFLTPVLNGISPGLGNSRASGGTCTFFITNGVIRSDDLEIRSTALRLQYRGTVDLQSRLNARVEAELLRDVWLVGPLVSTVLWPVTKMFEYKVTGTLAEPKTEPVYIIPKIVLMPFHPFRTLKSLFPQDQGQRTNAPPVFQNLEDQP
jgi:hypothetical protein